MAIGVTELKTGRDTNFIQHQIVQMVGSYLEEELVTAERKFSSGDATALHDRLADELTQTFVCDDALLAKLLRQLEENRILLLTGDQEIGKRTVALYLGHRLTQTRTLVVESLERRIDIDLRDLASDAAHFGERAIVFIDAFDQRNRQLRAFFAGGNTLRWSQLTEALRENKTYLIFTSATVNAPLRHVAAHITCELSPLTRDRIETAVEQRLSWMARQSEAVTERLRILSEQRQQVTDALRTLPRIAAFVKQFVRDDTDLDSALLRFLDVRYWFRTALDHDAGAWMFVLALTLAQPTRNAESASWADFERLYRAMSERLRGDAEFSVRRNKADLADEPERTIAQSFCDDLLLERCRAVVVKDADRLGDVVQFEHPSLRTELWQTLLAHHRRALMAVLPVLTRIAEEREEWSARVLAAQAIGRIGEIDPRRITLPLLQRWSSSEDRTKRPLVGRMLQGVLGSTNDIYREFMLAHVDALAHSAAAYDSHQTNNALLTAIGTYSQIGVYDQDRAMQQLGNIVKDILAPIVENVHALGREVETVDTILAETSSRRAARGLIHRRVQLSGVASRLLEAQAPALVALEQAIVHLCLTHDPIQILRKMRDWSSKGGEGTTTLIALLFLYDGIAADLQSLPLVFASASTDALHHLCGFLADIHESISGTFKFAASLQRELRQKLHDCLVAWAVDGALNADLRPSVITLFGTLATARRGAVKETISAVLHDEAFTRDRGMRSLAQDINNRLMR
jgi:hypothetical protein